VHFVPGGVGIDQVPLEVLMGQCFVADARGMRGPLGPAQLDELAVPDGVERLLIKSDNSDLWRRLPVSFPDEYVCLSPQGARWVVEHGIRLVGVDFLSVEQKGAPGHPTHVELLSNGVVIVEGLDLGNAEPGPSTLAVLPLLVVDGDGGPARAILMQD
jgi:arylformamidase